MAGMAGPTIGQATSREIKRVLSEARWSVSEAARRLGVDRRTVHRWLKGDKVDLDDLSRLAEMTGKSIVIRLGHKDTPRPEWAEGLEAQMNQMTTKLDASDEWHRRAAEREQGRVVEAATQGAVEAVRLFLAENDIRLAKDVAPDPEPTAEDHRPR